MISIFKLINFRILTSLIAIVFFMNPSLVKAAGSLSLILTIDGGNSSVSVNGEEVELGWYIDGPVTNCVIKQKIGTNLTVIHTINTNNLPASGTKMVTPPENTSTNYILICDQAQDTVVVNTDFPIVEMSIDQGTNLNVNPLTGRVDNVSVRWNSQNTNKCSLMWREKASAPGVKIFETNTGDYWYQYGTSGLVGYDGDPRSITETTTFFITCYNDNIGESITKSITLNVSNPAPPSEPALSMWSPNFPTVSASETYGYAWVNIGFNAQNVTRCYYSSYYTNGVQYSNPPGWGTSDTITSYNFTGIRISTTTDFRIRCTRGEVNIAGTIYPAVEITKTLRIIVVPPVGVTSIEEWDRSAVPPVTATILANPNPTNKNALTGLANTNVTIARNNADFCNRYAYYTKGTIDDYSDDVSYSLTGWSSTVWGNGTSSFSVNLSTTTRLAVNCVREYDLGFGDEGEIENGTEWASTVVVTIDSEEVLPDPSVSVYGNAFVATVDSIWGSAVEINGFNAIYGTPKIIENSSNQASANRISFPFSRPSGMNGLLDMYIKVCDENDGLSKFRIFSENNGLISSFNTDSSSAVSNYCNSSTIKYIKIGDELNFVNGEKITIECDHEYEDGERCRFSDILFGVDGVVTTPQVNPIVTSVNVPVLWISENTSQCDTFKAQKINGSNYTWYTGSSIIGIVNNNISTTTSFSLRCRRGGDGKIDDSVVQVYVPFSDVISAETMVATGQCLDDGSLGFGFGVAIEAPEGYGADENGFCSPLVDLAAGAISVNLSAANPDGVNGQYDNVSLLLIVENWGPGNLPINSNVPYKFVIDFDNSIAAENYISPLYYLNEELISPTNPTIPTESSALDNRVDNVIFGMHEFCARVNKDGTVFPEANTLLSNNTKCINISIPVPHPPMSITTDNKLIRRNQLITINWSAHTSYNLNCIVRGPGGVRDDFDASDRYPSPGGAYTNSVTIDTITNASEFILQCTEPITNTVFTEKLQVDVIPESEEI